MNNKKDEENHKNDITFNKENDPFQIKHRKRTSKKQLEVLEKTFEGCIRPDAKLRKKLGDQLGMTPRAVQIWFQNRRAKVKKTLNCQSKKKVKVEQSQEGIENIYNTVEVYDTTGMYENYGAVDLEKEYLDNAVEGNIYGDGQRDSAYNDTKYTELYSKDTTYPQGYVQDTKYNEVYPYGGYPSDIKYTTFSIENRPEYPPVEYGSYVSYNTYGEYPQNIVPYPPGDFGYPSGDYPPMSYQAAEEYYHKHHDEYYHNLYIDGNGRFKEEVKDNSGYPSQYTDREYYKDYKQNYLDNNKKDKK